MNLNIAPRGSEGRNKPPAIINPDSAPTGKSEDVASTAEQRTQSAESAVQAALEGRATPWDLRSQFEDDLQKTEDIIAEAEDGDPELERAVQRRQEILDQQAALERFSESPESNEFYVPAVRAKAELVKKEEETAPAIESAVQSAETEAESTEVTEVGAPEEEVPEETLDEYTEEEVSRLEGILEKNPQMLPGNRKRIEAKLKDYRAHLGIPEPVKQPTSFFGKLASRVSGWFSRKKTTRELPTEPRVVAASSEEQTRLRAEAMKNKARESEVMRLRAEAFRDDEELQRLEGILKKHPNMLPGNRKRIEGQLAKRKELIMEANLSIRLPEDTPTLRLVEDEPADEKKDEGPKAGSGLAAK